MRIDPSPAAPPRTLRRRRRTTGPRTAAVLGLVGALWMVAYALVVAIDDFPRGLLVLVCVLLAASGVWEGVLRRGWGRVAALSVAGVAGVGIGLLTADERFVRHLLLLGLGAVVWYVGARLAFRPAVAWPPAARPQRPVLFVNPRSGEGKAGRHRLDAEARDRGIEPVEMRPGDDLAELVRGRIDGGADAVAMAGGDGSQAVVATAAAKAGLPYACIPSGTRNHFALDLGVDRDDVVGALDAFVDGGERLVDLGEVNGRVFVNNVSLGVYAEAVHRPGYRRAKMRTLLDTAPEVLGPAPGTTTLRWTTPGGRTMTGAAVILVGNNQYRLSGAAGAGTRPAVDQGQLGITVVDPPSTQGNRRRRPWRQWSATEFRVESDGPVPAGIDGEAVVLESPVCFRIAPSALRVRIATHHPGASPSSIEPVGALPALAALAGIAMGRDPRNLPTRPAPVGGAGIPAQRSGSVPDQVVEPGQDRPRRGAPSPPP